MKKIACVLATVLGLAFAVPAASACPGMDKADDKADADKTADKKSDKQSDKQDKKKADKTEKAGKGDKKPAAT